MLPPASYRSPWTWRTEGDYSRGMAKVVALSILVPLHFHVERNDDHQVVYGAPGVRS